MVDKETELREDGPGSRDYRPLLKYALGAALITMAPAVAHAVFRFEVSTLILITVPIAVVVGFIILSLSRTIATEADDNEPQASQLTTSHQELLDAYNRIQQDLDTARKIQRNLLPEKWAQPLAEYVRFAQFYLPEMAVGGDYYDLKSLPEKRVAILLADVSGHGMSAAFVTGLIKTLLEFGRVSPEDPASFIAELNESLCSLTPSDSFAAIIYGIYSVESHILRFVNAGHIPLPIVIRKESGKVESIDTNTGLLAGVEKGIRYEVNEVELMVGDKLVLATDGIVDALDAERNRLGRERLLQLLGQNAEASAEELKDAVLRLLETYSAGASQEDDCTMGVMEVIR